MKKLYYLLMLSCAIWFAACEKPVEPEPEPQPQPDTTEVVVPKTEWEKADSAYTIADYTVPSHTALKMAIHLCANNPSEANLDLLHQRIAELQPKEMPYNMVATINGDPQTRMGFAWFTNEGIMEGEVQIIAMKDATEDDFKSNNGVMTIQATATPTKKALRYVGQCSYIYTKADLPAGTKYNYVSHKALADNLTPGTDYSWRVGYGEYWSPIAHFHTEDVNQGEFSFIVMSDSHIMNKEYVDYARRCALAAVKTAPDARFCCFPGDFVEDGTLANSEWEWERWFEESMEPIIKAMPIVPTDGNHDDSPNINYTYHFNTDNSFNEITTKPQFEGITYSFVYGDALFLVFSMQDFWRLEYSYVDWNSVYLTDYLGYWFRRETRNNPDTKYRISLAHFNLFSGSDHSTDEEPPLFRACMLPVFKDCEIDVALQGHDHTYEVIGPVDPDSLTPILSAITDREEVGGGTDKNMTGYKGGTYRTDDGTFYFISATCGRKRYSPHSRERMERDYAATPEELTKGKHNVKNYFDLFTGMFGQPGEPCFTKITVKEDCLEFNSYTADDDKGNVSLLNTMRVIRTKNHTIPMAN